VQCLFCGKGIGPIRQLRDLEFCSDTHRTQFQDRYRRSLYEALAPEPAPKLLAEFLEQSPVSAGPTPHAKLEVQPKPLLGERVPGMTLEAAGISMKRTGLILGRDLATMLAQPAWQDATAPYGAAVPAVAFTMGIEPARRTAAGAVCAEPAAILPAAHVSPAARKLADRVRRLAEPMAMPSAILANAPAQAAPAATRLVAATLASTATATSSPVFSSTCAPAAPACHGAIRLPVAPGAERLASALHPLEAGPFLPRQTAATLQNAVPVALETQGVRDMAIFLPKPPALDYSLAGKTAPRALQPEPGLPVAQTALFATLSAADGVPPALPRIAVMAPSISTPLAAPRAAQPEANVPVAIAATLASSAELIQPAMPRIEAAAPKIPAPLALPQAGQPEPRLAASGTAMLPGAAAASCVAPALPLLESELQAMGPVAAPPSAALPAVSASRHAVHAAESASLIGPLGEHVHPTIACEAAPAGVPTASAMPEGPLAEAASQRNPRSAEPQTLASVAHQAAKPAPLMELPPLSSAIGSAPAREIQAPTPAAPAAAAPSWNAVPVAPPDHALVPRAGTALPRIDCMPAPAGAISAFNGTLPPSVARAVRSCAVLWTLRVVRMCHPPFLLDPVRVRFNELVRPEAGLLYTPDLEDKRPAKVRAINSLGVSPKRKIKWQYAGLAAAAMLAAGVLIPQVAPKSIKATFPWHGTSMRQWVSNHATRSFADDFRAGLSQWKGVHAKWPASWSYSTDGFIHPGQLALYRPSVPLSDYRFEFMAQIESKSVDWVVRAHDADNYYALKFTVVQPGPRPLVAMVRYPVIDGNKGERVATPLRMMIHANTPYRVTVDVKGNTYHAYVEGQEADFWTEDRLKTGGVGFFSESGERARVYWVKLESHGDLLGRICSLLSGKGSQGATDKEKEANGLPAWWYDGNEWSLWPGRQGNGGNDRPGGSHQPRAVESCFAAPGWEARRSRAGAGARLGRRRTPPGSVFRAGPIAV